MTNPRESGSSVSSLKMSIEGLSEMKVARREQILIRSVGRMEEVRPLITKIMKDVERKGDEALLRFTKKFDGVEMAPGKLRVSKAEIAKAYRAVEELGKDLLPQLKKLVLQPQTYESIEKGGTNLVSWMKQSHACITQYHEAERDQLKSRRLSGWQTLVRSPRWPEGIRLLVGQEKPPIDRVGIYVPGGHAVLFTTALMAVTPARVAGVREIVVCSPPSRNGDIDPMIIVAADLAGATTIIRAGGAQAIAAMAYGTKSVPKVDKIFGPGNTYVSAAKTYVTSLGICAIDFLAGPSEILVVADDTARADLVARNMISQAEHDPDACAILVTTSKRIACAVRAWLPIILADSKRNGERLSDVARRSLSRYGAIITVGTIDEALEFSNEFAPEHLQLMTKNPKCLLKKVRNAGAIFLGKFSPVAVSDYVSANHILPTGGAARYTSGINLGMFYKTPSKIKCTRVAMKAAIVPLIAALSMAEGLFNQHGLSAEATLLRRAPKLKE